MKLPEKPLPWQVGLILVVGILAVSTSAIFIRLAIEAAQASGVGFSVFLAASRLAIATLILLPSWHKLYQTPISWRSFSYAAAAGLCLALHFATWITSLSFTSIAASTTLVTTNPIWVTILSWLWLHQKTTRLTVAGIAIAVAGSIFIALEDANAIHAGSNPLLGDALALMGAIMASLYLLLGRQAQRQGLGISSYIAVAYTTAAVVLIPFSLLAGSSYFGYPSVVYLYILLMAVFPQIVGHTSFNWALRWISPTLVTLMILFEPVGASFLGFLIFGEVPSPFVLLGAVVLLAGVATAVIGAKDSRETES